MRNILASAVIIICLSLGVWQIKMEGQKETTEEVAALKAGMQCPALYGVPGVEDRDLPGAVKHCSCEIGAMLAQTDGTVRCSYCGKQDK